MLSNDAFFDIELKCAIPQSNLAYLRLGDPDFHAVIDKNGFVGFVQYSYLGPDIALPGC